MVDELHDRQYQAGRNALNQGIGNLASRLQAFARGYRHLNRIQFAAPWAKRDAHCG